MEEKSNDQLQAVCVAAGALAVFAASLDRAKQWRSWVFVVLNILLLAILLTSKNAAYCSNASIEQDNCLEECDFDSKTERKEERRKEISEDGDVINIRLEVMKVSEKKDQVEEEKEKIIECDVVNGKSTPMVLSNEELNEKVEAFIARFRRQYLVCADEKGKSTSGGCSFPAKNGGDVLSKKHISNLSHSIVV